MIATIFSVLIGLFVVGMILLSAKKARAMKREDNEVKAVQNAVREAVEYGEYNTVFTTRHSSDEGVNIHVLRNTRIGRAIATLEGSNISKIYLNSLMEEGAEAYKEHISFVIVSESEMDAINTGDNPYAFATVSTDEELEYFAHREKFKDAEATLEAYRNGLSDKGSVDQETVELAESKIKELKTQKRAMRKAIIQERKDEKEVVLEERKQENVQKQYESNVKNIERDTELTLNTFNKFSEL